jgi:hypothetical protein
MRERSQQFFQGMISSEDFLASCNSDMTKLITNEVIKLLENRKLALLRPWQELSSHTVKNSNSE